MTVFFILSYLILSLWIHFYYLCSYHIDTTCLQPGYKAQHYYCKVTKQLVRRSNAQYAVGSMQYAWYVVYNECNKHLETLVEFS